MAAGQGTRMRSAIPKVLHPVCGRPMVAWPVLAARAAGAERIAVIASPGRDLGPGLPPGTETVLQPEADGTGGAVRAASELLAGLAPNATVVVLSGDVPLVGAETITELLATHHEAGAAATVLTALLEDPGTYGRVVRDEQGHVARIVETKEAGDADPAELEIREINTGIYAFEAAPLLAALERISNDNAQGEYYLPDVLPLIATGAAGAAGAERGAGGAGGTVAARVAEDHAVLLGVNNRADLAAVEAEARRRILHRHLLNGVTITDPASTWVDADVELAADVTLHPGTYLRGATRIGAGSQVGPHATITDGTLAERVTVLHSVVTDSSIGEDSQIGPFAHLRPGTILQPGARAGTFVELKNSELGPGAKVPHLAYVGDADIGAGANLGAGTITANYDGFRKHRTRVGDNARVGVDTMLIAPVDIGPGAYTGGGSVISEDVPAGALGISRPAQENIEGFAERKAAIAKEEDNS
ncbi:MAG TPA: bifunctional UDP-N-acetylglucosamine diphosphorylase/glucosamine-1-phosphate N-acetyltransferase GlmU [Solirubrobacterales bacterium]|nr:bifunctional UDP-N-acetylglucosamine diphosphorylase/glucosamine-1-phosphate N-acetyltransferase GlmU [Solirubrobacterales bacterium]